MVFLLWMKGTYISSFKLGQYIKLEIYSYKALHIAPY
jgi:hypothetical protein